MMVTLTFKDDVDSDAILVSANSILSILPLGKEGSKVEYGHPNNFIFVKETSDEILVQLFSTKQEQ